MKSNSSRGRPIANDTSVQTLFMNMFFGSRMKGMPPKLVSDDGKNIVIRPLAYVAETDLERWAAHRQFPIIPCTLCGSQENLQRVQTKKMLREWERHQVEEVGLLPHFLPALYTQRNDHNTYRLPEQ